MNCKAPKFSWTGSQALVHTKLMPKCLIDGQAPSISFQMIAAMSTNVPRAAIAVSRYSRRSPNRSRPLRVRRKPGLVGTSASTNRSFPARIEDAIEPVTIL